MEVEFEVFGAELIQLEKGVTLRLDSEAKVEGAPRQYSNVKPALITKNSLTQSVVVKSFDKNDKDTSSKSIIEEYRFSITLGSYEKAVLPQYFIFDNKLGGTYVGTFPVKDTKNLTIWALEGGEKKEIPLNSKFLSDITNLKVIYKNEGRALGLFISDHVNHWPLEKRIPFLLDMYRQTLEILLDLHARGLIHRDFHSHNLILSSSGKLRVIDWELLAPINRGTIFEYNDLRDIRRSYMGVAKIEGIKHVRAMRFEREPILEIDALANKTKHERSLIKSYFYIMKDLYLNLMLTPEKGTENKAYKELLSNQLELTRKALANTKGKLCSQVY